MDSETGGLPAGWEVRLGLNERLYYYSKQSQIVQILPPPEAWRCRHSLPYGWEMATDYDNKNYYINHITQSVTYEDPRTEDDQSSSADFQQSPEGLTSPQPRECEIVRDPNLGFGFIAGSEKPVIIRSVTPGGPSEGLLLPDDQIVKIGSENVMMADRERVIELIRKRSDKVILTVLQPNRSANSSFLNPAKKTFRTMDRPKVRFADDVIVNGQERTEGSSPLLLSPGVLRIELENTENRSFRFQPETTAGDVVATLCDQLGFRDPNLFSLVLTPPGDYEQEIEKHCKTSSRGSTTSVHQPLCSSSPDSLLIAPWDCISKVVNNPSVRHHSCHFRLEFMPKDFHKLARNDPGAFRYLYLQCVNDVVSGEVYADDLSKDDLIKLATIQMQELLLSALPATPTGKLSPGGSDNALQKNAFRFSGVGNKLTLKHIEKEYGLKRFLPPSLVASMHKDNPTARGIRKSIQQYLKASSGTAFIGPHSASPVIPTSPFSTSGGNPAAALLQLRLQYLKILSPQHLFGGRYFTAAMQALMESDITILVGHNYGISQMINSKTKMVSVMTEFQHVSGFEVAARQPESSATMVKIEYADKKELLLAMEPQDAQNFAFMVAGYCRVYGNIDMVLTLPISESTSAPLYFGPHKVKPSHWNYPPSSSLQSGSSDRSTSPSFFYCDFSEPITPSVLSQEVPPLSTPKKNGFQRPATPPPSQKIPMEGEEVLESNFAKTKLGDVGNSDTNNNSSFRTNSHEATYEEIGSSLPESPASSLSAGQYSDRSPSTSPYYNENVISSSNGYLVPTPPGQRTTRVKVQVEDVKRDDSEGDADWMDLMKALGAADDKDGDVEDETFAPEVTSDDPLPPPPNTREEVEEIEVPPPPDYPPPKRANPIASRENTNSVNSRDENNKPQRMSSFKPRNSELKVFTLTRSETAATPGSGPDSGAGTPEGKSAGSNMDDIQDPVTRRKLQETEDLIQYFRQRREQLSGASSRESLPSKGSRNFDSSGEFGSGEIDAPVVVPDIAAGNKRLRRAEKAASKNRKSWAGSDTLTRELSAEDQRPMSMSNPDLSGSSMRKPRGRSLFSRLFGERKRRSHSMYETSGTSSAYGRRRRRFRLPRLKLRRAFTLSSIKKHNRKSVLPTSESETPTKSNHFRFRPFSSKKNKSHGVFVISEPCDGVRGVDLLPSGKYTVAGTMFHVNGEARESEIITLDSKRPSRECLPQLGEEKRCLSDSAKTPEATSSPLDGDKAEVKLRSSSPPGRAQRPVSFSTFQQAVLDGFANGSPSKLATVDEGRRNSLPRGMDQSSPCELSLTESSEALQEIVKAREEHPSKNDEENGGPTLRENEIPSAELIHASKPARKPIPAFDPIVPAETAMKTSSLPPRLRLQPVDPKATSTPIQPAQNVIKKRPSKKRPAPQPPVLKPRNSEELEKVGQSDSISPSDWYKDEAFERKSPEENSLITEIFSYLENSNAENDEDDASSDVGGNVSSPEAVLPYGEGYAMPGVVSVKLADEDLDSWKEKAQQKTMLEILYREMLKDHSSLPPPEMTDPGEESSDTDDCDSDDSQADGVKQGSYDVTSDGFASDDAIEDDGSVVLKSYGKSRGERDAMANGDDSLMTSPVEHWNYTNGSDVNTGSTRFPTAEDANIKKSQNSAELNRKLSDRAGSYSMYQNLITPPGYNKPGAKRSSVPNKPAVPPKPVFH